MLVAFQVTRALFPDDWMPVEAEVETTRVLSSREGSLTWTLLADVTYQVDARRYTKSDFKILHETEREDTLARQGQWPVGKLFTVYVQSSDPQSIALVKDGGRESLAVAVAALTPGLLIIVVFAVILVRRRGRRHRGDPKRSHADS